MEIGRDIVTGLQKLIKDRKEKGLTVTKIHLSKAAEKEIREYLNLMYGTSYRGEGEERNDPLKTLLGCQVQIHSEPTNQRYWIGDEINS